LLAPTRSVVSRISVASLKIPFNTGIDFGADVSATDIVSIGSKVEAAMFSK
jgi:hypothetical protein